MNRLFAALMAILLLALPIAAFAEGGNAARGDPSACNYAEAYTRTNAAAYARCGGQADNRQLEPVRRHG